MVQPINIMVGGPASEISLEEVEKHREEVWIGADFGATFLLNHGIIPQIAIGDFDSTFPVTMKKLKDAVAEIRRFPPEKDYTDTQLAVKVALTEFQADQINLFGATGGRLDQLLSNLLFPLMTEFQAVIPKLVIFDRQNEMRYYLPGDYEIQKRPGMKYLAFVNLTAVTGLTLPDEKYRLQNFDAEIPISWSSNEFNGSVNHFSFKSGVIAVIQSKDSLATAPRLR